MDTIFSNKYINFFVVEITCSFIARYDQMGNNEYYAYSLIVYPALPFM